MKPERTVTVTAFTCKVEEALVDSAESDLDFSERVPAISDAITVCLSYKLTLDGLFVAVKNPS